MQLRSIETTSSLNCIKLNLKEVLAAKALNITARCRLTGCACVCSTFAGDRVCAISLFGNGFITFTCYKGHADWQIILTAADHIPELAQDAEAMLLAQIAQCSGYPLESWHRVNKPHMCDTFVALPVATLDGSVLFGKNSDRPRGEIQDVVTFPAQTNVQGQQVQCTYIQIPQAEHTYGVILSKPRWMWGAEMGANDCGVVIGNEAVWTTQPYQSTGLLGMDLVRLGLERGETALAALQVIISLLEQYGQGGNCAEHRSFTYHNSFLIADVKEAWVLETAGKYWVAERVIEGTRSISNSLSIRSAGDMRHPEVIQDAIAQGLCNSEADFDFAKLFSEGGVEASLSPNSRAGRVQLLCQQQQGQFTLDTAKAILRDHQGGVCMHGGFETRGSQISRLTAQQGEHWLIKRPFPCQQEYELVALPERVGTEGHRSSASPLRKG